MQNTSDAVNLSSVNFTGSIVAQDESKSNFKLLGGYQQEFEISRFLNLLTPGKQPKKYHCPNCNGNDFAVEDDGRYQCFNKGCSVKVPFFRLSYQSNGLAQTKANPVLLDSQGNATYHYPGGHRVKRTLKRKGEPWESGSNFSQKKLTWLPYRWELIDQSSKWLCGAEGEKCVESIVQIGKTAITWCGSGKWMDGAEEHAKILYRQGLHGFVYFRDNDATGVSKADKVVEVFRAAGIWVVVVNPSDYKPEYQVDKFDIADLLELEPSDDVLKWVDSQVLKSFELAATGSSKNSKTSKSSIRSATTATVTPKEINWDDIQEKYLNCKTDRDKEVYKLAIAQEHNLNPYDVGRILSASHDDDSASIGDEVARALVSRDINLSDHLPDYLADALKQYAAFQKINQSTVLTALLTTVSSLHKPGSKCWLHPGLGFSSPPTLFSAIVAESGSKKSPIFREICKNPLGKIRREELKNYADSLSEFQKLADEEKADRAEPPAPPPMFVSDATGEGISQFSHDYPNKSILLAVDELAGMFNSQNAYRGGRGSDRQDLLSAYDGSGVSVLRAGGLKRESQYLYLSILGTIQPDVVAKIIGDNQDSDGTFARFLFCRQPNVASFLPELSSNVSVSGLLSGLYQNILDRPITEFSLSNEAFKIFQNFYNQCEQLRIKSPSPCERYFWGKAEGLAGRLAMNLEVLANPMGNGDIISEKSMQSAIALISFYHSELTALMVSVDPVNSLAPHLIKLIELSMRRGEISPRDVYTCYSAKDRPNSQKVRSWMVEAQTLGLGTVKKDGRSFKFRCNDGNDGGMMAMPPSFEILTQQGLQPNDGNDGNDGDFSEKNSRLNTLGVNDDRSALSLDISPHPETLGDTFFEQNSHQRHHCHQTAETLTVQGQTMMAAPPSISPSLQLDYFNSFLFDGADVIGDGYDWLGIEMAVHIPVPAPVPNSDRRFNIGEIVKFAGGNGIVNDVNGDYVLVSPLPSGDDVWVQTSECKPNPWFR